MVLVDDAGSGDCKGVAGGDSVIPVPTMIPLSLYPESTNKEASIIKHKIYPAEGEFLFDQWACLLELTRYH